MKIGSVFAKSRKTFKQSRIIYNSFSTKIQRKYLFRIPIHVFEKTFFQGVKCSVEKAADNISNVTVLKEL